MKQKPIFLILMGSALVLRSGITYDFSGGRMGDNLISYLHAKWISYKHGLTLLYRPFNFSDKFMFHFYEQQLQDVFCVKRLHNQNYSSLSMNDDECYCIPYFSDFKHEYPGGYFPHDSSFAIDWKDDGFKKIIRQCLAPVEPLQHIVYPPEPCLSVAMHVRKGGRYEPVLSCSDQLKFPPNSFFAEQLVYVCKAFPERTIYAFIFTDDINPAAIAEEILQFVGDHNVTIDFRAENTSDTSYVLDDFFSLPLFDVLIRPCSNFSYVAGKLGNYLLEISPKTYAVIDGLVKIVSVDVTTKGSYV